MPLRRALSQVEPYRPGRPLAEVQRELGLERIVKLASNEGPFPPLPAAVEAMARTADQLNRYPDGAAMRLREALAERHRVPVEQVVIGNGADELIRLACLATLEAGEWAAFPWPSFPSYVAGVAVAGAKPMRAPSPADRLDLEALLATVDERTRLVLISNPNNPTGAHAGRQEVVSFLDRLPERTLCVLDEAYHEYVDPALAVDGAALVAEGRERLCVLRTFSKVHGLAALRIGYAVASPEIADALDRVRNIFNANQPAQEAALASLGEPAEIDRRVKQARAGRERLAAILDGAGLRTAPTEGNFVYAAVPAGYADLPADAEAAGESAAGALTRALMHEGVLVRHLAAFGAPAAIRVTAGTDEEIELFAGALARATEPFSRA